MATGLLATCPYALPSNGFSTSQISFLVSRLAISVALPFPLSALLSLGGRGERSISLPGLDTVLRVKAGGELEREVGGTGSELEGAAEVESSAA